MDRTQRSARHVARHPISTAALALALATAAHAGDAAQANSPTWTAPAQAASQPNPLAADPGAKARGKALYDSACAACHGPKGKGDGPAGAFLQRGGARIRPRDLSDPALAQESDGALFWKISEGRTPMPAFHETLSDEQRWEVVTFVRTLAPAPPATTPSQGGR